MSDIDLSDDAASSILQPFNQHSYNVSYNVKSEMTNSQ